MAGLGSKDVTIQLLRRRLVTAVLGSAEPKQDYTPVMTTRAEVKSRAGSNEFASVDINGVAATHTFTIRYTTIPIDTRDRLRDAKGGLYKILAVENVNLQNTTYRLHCSNQGLETVEAAR